MFIYYQKQGINNEQATTRIEDLGVRQQDAL
jgi:hypothetical protein